MTSSATVPTTGLEEMETYWPWNWRPTGAKTVKMTLLIRPLITNFKMTVRTDCAVSACSPLPLSIKAIVPWFSGEGRVCFWTGAALPYPACQIEQTFLSTHQASLLAFDWRAAESHFVTYLLNKTEQRPIHSGHEIKTSRKRAFSDSPEADLPWGGMGWREPLNPILTGTLPLSSAPLITSMNTLA